MASTSQREAERSTGDYGYLCRPTYIMCYPVSRRATNDRRRLSRGTNNSRWNQTSFSEQVHQILERRQDTFIVMSSSEYQSWRQPTARGSYPLVVWINLEFRAVLTIERPTPPTRPEEFRYYTSPGYEADYR